MFKEKVKEDLGKALAQFLKVGEEDVRGLLEKPKNPEHGELAFPCFKIAKGLSLSPQEAAKKIQKELVLPVGVNSAEALGPFLNFRFCKKQVVEAVVVEHFSSEAGKKAAGHSRNKKKKVIVEYSSPNIAKPFHVGHLRATLIGNALDKTYRYLQFDTVSINHLGDWGTQFGFVWAGCELWGKPENPGVIELVDLYRQATKVKEEQEKRTSVDESLPNVNEIARAYFLDLEAGKDYAVEFWKWCLDISLKYFKETYARLGVSFDHYTGESFYSDKLEALKDEIEKSGILLNSEGALGVDLGEKLGFARIYTPDGRSLYLTRDLATAEYRAKTFNFDRCMYVVGMPQSLHFEQIKGILRALKKPYADKIEHVAFGHVMGMKTRGGGEFIELNSFLDEATERALEAYRTQVAKRPEGLDERVVATQVALAAIIFGNLSRSRIKDVHFSWESALEFQGDTGPYILYAYARINGIKERAKGEGVAVNPKADSGLLLEESAFSLAVLLDEFEGALEQTIKENEPAVLASYALDVAKAFSKAYLDLKVLGVEKPVAEARLALFEATRVVLGDALRLLGIEPLERM